MAFFERGHTRRTLRSGFSSRVALVAQSGEAILSRGEQRFRSRARRFDQREFRLPRCNQAFLLLPFCRESLQFAFADRDPLAHARHFAIELGEQMSRRHRLFLGLALVFFKAIEQRSVLLDFARQSERQYFFLAQGALKFFEQPQHVTQLALHRQRSLAALLTAGDGHVVEAFSSLREKKRVGTG